MTEAEWLTGTGLGTLIASLGPVSERKFKLFACACCRRVWSALSDHRGRKAVEEAERHYDGAGAEKRPADGRGARYDSRSPAEAAASLLLRFSGWQTALHVACFAQDAAPDPGAEKTAQIVLLRDVVGNPFRPVAFDPDWRTDTVASLARVMYDGREFGAMPILADALQDAACDNDDVLSHCRDTSLTHVRGCWVVDLVLGKE